MRTNFVLIDAENIKPDNLEKLKHEHYRVVLFVGAKVTSVSKDVVRAMQSLGVNGRYVMISSIGPNALDFHIAYYIGKLSLEHPGSCFHIVTKDKGFDPLIKHLREEKISCSRWESVLEVPSVSINGNESSKQKVSGNPKQRASQYYSKRIATNKARPATLKTLQRSIHDHFVKRISEEEVTKVVEALTTSGDVVINGKKVIYPKCPTS